MYILNIAKTIKKMTFKKFKDFVFENYDRIMGFAKENGFVTVCNLFKRKK